MKYQKKTQPKSWRRITNENFKAIWLDRHTAYGNQKTCSTKYRSRVPCYFCQTPNGNLLNTEFKVRLTSKDDKGVYNQSPSKPIYLKKDLTVELTLLHKYGIITVLLFWKYARPILHRKKTNGKLRLFVDVSKIVSLIADDYTNNNHPVCTLSDAAEHLAGKSLFCKPDNSQAYQCFEMADQCQWNCLLSILLAELLPTGDLHKNLADLCLPFQVSCPSTWTQFQGWLKSSINGWYWNCSQQCYGPYPEHSGGLSLHSQWKIEIDNWKVPFWSQASWNSRQNHFHRGVWQQTHKIQSFPNKLRIPKKKFCSTIWGSWINTEIIFPGWLKSSANSINF